MISISGHNHEHNNCSQHNCENNISPFSGVTPKSMMPNFSSIMYLSLLKGKASPRSTLVRCRLQLAFHPPTSSFCIPSWNSSAHNPSSGYVQHILLFPQFSRFHGLQFRNIYLHRPGIVYNENPSHWRYDPRERAFPGRGGGMVLSICVGGRGEGELYTGWNLNILRKVP